MISRPENFTPTLNDRIEIISSLPKFNDLQDTLNHVRILGNDLVHGNYTATQALAFEMIQRTFNVIQELYERN